MINATEAIDATVAASALERMCAAVADEGYTVERNFLPPAAIAALAADARRHDAAGAFRGAAVGRGAQRTVRREKRGDRILWLEQADANPATRPVWSALADLRAALNRALFLGLLDFEGHYAIYPSGASYERHRDRFRDDGERVLSFVLYLNDQWTAADGGALRLYLSGDVTQDIPPEGGKLVCFLADRFEHEVLVATRERMTLTGWFRRRPH